MRKVSRKPKRKTSRKPKRKPSRKPKRKPSRKPKRKVSRKPKRKTSRKPKRKVSRKPKRKVSRKPKRKTHTCIIPTTTGNRAIIGMKNIGNTCYMDSVLFPLIFKSTPYIKSTIFKKITPTTDMEILRKKLRNVLAILHNKLRQNEPNPTVSSLKKQLASSLCRRLQSKINLHKYHTLDQEDAGEFLQSIADIFKMYGMKFITTTYGTNSLAKKVKRSNLVKTSEVKNYTNESVVYSVTAEATKIFGRENQPIRISKFLNTKEDSGELDVNNLFTPSPSQTFKRRIAIKQVIDSPCILFYYIRPYWNMSTGEEDVYRKPIICTKQITLKSKRILKLNAVVVHIGTVGGGHYVVYFKCNNNWFLYDDINQMKKNTRTRFIGSYENLMKSRKIYGKVVNVKTHGTIYYYI